MIHEMAPMLTLGLLFLATLILIALGEPVAFVLGGVGTIFYFFLISTKAISAVPLIAFSTSTSFILLAVPLFIFMALILETAGVAEGLFDMMYKWFGGVRGGLAVGTVLISTIFAAMVGIMGAACVTMTLISLPVMLKRRYEKSFAIGSISGAGLGLLIPPSVDMIIYSAVASLSLGRMFAAGYFPGFILSISYSVYILTRAYFQPTLAPAIPLQERATWREKFISVKAIALPMFVIITVMGTVFSGIATPTEAAAVGCVGALICSAVNRRLSWSSFKDSVLRAGKINLWIMWIIIGASIFGSFISRLGLADTLVGFVITAELNPWAVLIIMQLSFFLLGAMMDDIPIMMITIPIYMPIIVALGFNPIWFAILFIINMQMAYLTPPFGYMLFYIKGVVSSEGFEPKGVTMADIYRSIWPYLILQASCLALMMALPGVVLYLPNLFFGAEVV